MILGKDFSTDGLGVKLWRVAMPAGCTLKIYKRPAQYLTGEGAFMLRLERADGTRVRVAFRHTKARTERTAKAWKSYLAGGADISCSRPDADYLDRVTP